MSFFRHSYRQRASYVMLAEANAALANLLERAIADERPSRKDRRMSGRFTKCGTGGRWIMIDILVYLAILVIVVVLVWWLLQQLPLPPPAMLIIQIAVVVVVAIVVIMLLLNLAGHGPPLRLR